MDPLLGARPNRTVRPQPAWDGRAAHIHLAPFVLGDRDGLGIGADRDHDQNLDIGVVLHLGVLGPECHRVYIQVYTVRALLRKIQEGHCNQNDHRLLTLSRSLEN